MNSGCEFCIPPYISGEESLTHETYQMLFYRLERVALNVIKWENLPVGLDPVLIERYLFYRGNCVLFYDEILGQYIGLPMSTEYGWDVNSMPTDYEVIGFQGYRRMLNIYNSIIIWNDAQLSPSVQMTAIQATRLTNTLRTSDMHLEAQKVGKIVRVPETKKRGMEKILDRIKNFHLYTIASPATPELKDAVQVLDTELDYIGDKLDNHYSFLWHDALSYYGITSMTDKLSGVGKSEMLAEQSMAEANKQAMLMTRKKAADAFNKMFGQNIKVSFLSDEGLERRLKEDARQYNDSENGNGDTDKEDGTREV